ncbi:MAG: carboxypeptidase regulatory-like domain-containing protein [Sedimentisphaerales bacterium]|nr:carboxypeptidase regulatory-like domain-containing protein [Sedimentisphaerales bacterium]
MRKNKLEILCIGLMLSAFTNPIRAFNTKSIEIEQAGFTGLVVDEQGRAITGAKVSLYEIIYDEVNYTYYPKLLGESQTGTTGTFSFKDTKTNDSYRNGCIIAEKEGFSLSWASWNTRKGYTDFKIVLGRPVTLVGTVVDENDKPIPDAAVNIYLMVMGEEKNAQWLPSHLASKLFKTRTDIDGKFTFTGLPAWAKAEFVVAKTGRAKINTYKNSTPLNFTVGQKDIKLLMPVEARIEGVVVEKETGKPVSGVRLIVKEELNRWAQDPFHSRDDGT